MIKHNRVKAIFATSASMALIMASAPAGAIGTNAVSLQDSAPATTSAAVESSAPRAKGGSFLGGIFGCAADGNKQTIGAIAGAAIGGFAGNRIASGNRTLGTLIGGALGAAAGSAIGCKLQKNDQAKAERAVQQAVATNKTQTWSGDESGASGKVEVGQAVGAKLSDITFAKGVEPADNFAKVGGSYIATAAANVRSGPLSSASIIGKLATGQRVWVPAQVTGQPWMLVSENGVGQGYVSTTLLKRSNTPMAEKGCKMIKHTISAPGAADESETLQACKGADGQWTMTHV